MGQTIGLSSGVSIDTPEELPYCRRQNTVLPAMLPGSVPRTLAPHSMQELHPMAEHSNLRLMAILAHPDDESLGNGGALARYAAEGVDVTLVTATRGQVGWFGEPSENPGMQALGQLREAELRAAATELGIREVVLLDYVDGELGLADTDQVI